MKRMIATILAVATIAGVPTSLTTSASAASLTEDKVIELEYTDFIANQNYYRTLAKENGYVLDIEVPEEYADEEIARNQKMAEESTAVTLGMMRTADKPTETWNILTQGKYTLSAVNNAAMTLYSNYLFTGWTSYEVSVYNSRHDNFDFNVRAYENKFFLDDPLSSDETVEPGHTVIMYVQPSSSSAEWYLRFTGYSTMSGYVARDI